MNKNRINNIKIKYYLLIALGAKKQTDKNNYKMKFNLI